MLVDKVEIRLWAELIAQIVLYFIIMANLSEVSNQNFGMLLVLALCIFLVSIPFTCIRLTYHKRDNHKT